MPLWPREDRLEGYRPATLIQATLEHVASPDTFMTFFLSYIYDDLNLEEGSTVTPISLPPYPTWRDFLLGTQNK